MCRCTIACLALAACGDEPAGVERRAPPSILTAAVAANEHNVVSAIVTANVRNTDSVAVQFHVADAAAADSATPAVLVTGDSSAVAVPVLGLLPGRRYAMRAVAYGGGATTTGEWHDFTTGALPGDLPSYIASGAEASPGFVLFNVGRYAIVIDNGGRVVWYRRFADGVGLNVMAQPTGGYVLRPPTPAAGDVEPWIEVDALGAVVRTLGCARGLQARPHDIILERDGGYYLLCDETRTMDLTALGGVAEARVTATVVQRIGPTGALLFEWSAFEHFAIADLAASERAGANVNWTHGNALDLDADGGLVVSFRNLGELTKIDTRTGGIVWRLGGVRSQFVFDTPAPAFARQHSARMHGPGALVLLDNLGNPAESRAEHYLLDEAARTARLVRSYGSQPGVVTEIGGTVQPLAGGRTLVSFGTAGRVEEYDATGRVVWRIDGNPGYVFRAQRIASLYAPGVGTTR